jgi:Gpi18-like mannosyltransferase
MGNADFELLGYLAIVVTLLATVLFIATMNSGPRPHMSESQWLLSLALLGVLFPPFLLPGMHERYFFAADVFSLIYAFYSRGGWCVAVLVQIASALSYSPFLFRSNLVPQKFLAIGMCSALLWVVFDLAGPRRCREQEQRGNPNAADRSAP